MKTNQDMRKDACPTQRAETSEGWEEKWQVDSDAQESKSTPWEAEVYKL